MNNPLLRPDRSDCFWARKSIRKFLPQMPPVADIEEAIQKAQQAPSYKNTQPWEVVAVQGEKKDNLSHLFLELLEQDAEHSADLVAPESWPKMLQDRIDSNMKKRHAAMGHRPTPQTNKPRYNSQQRNFMFFDAPAVLFFYHHQSLSQWSILDAGMFIQNVMLTLCEKGIGSVPQAYLTNYAQEAKKFLEIPNDRRLLLGMAIGYADTQHALFNHFTDREEFSKVFRWL